MGRRRVFRLNVDEQWIYNRGGICGLGAIERRERKRDPDEWRKFWQRKTTRLRDLNVCVCPSIQEFRVAARYHLESAEVCQVRGDANPKVDVHTR